jgi:hypothetical protein
VTISVQCAFFELLHVQCLSFGQMGKGLRGEIDISWNRRAFGGEISRLLKITEAFEGRYLLTSIFWLSEALHRQLSISDIDLWHGKTLSDREGRQSYGES